MANPILRQYKLESLVGHAAENGVLTAEFPLRTDRLRRLEQWIQLDLERLETRFVAFTTRCSLLSSLER